MAERRMFAKTIIDSDAFLDMPLSTQALYFHLSMRADDDGFINNPKKIQRMIGASDDDARILTSKNFIIPFESGVVVIKHWKIHNYIQSDRYKPTSYIEEKNQLEFKVNKAYTLKDNPSDTECIHDVYTLDTQVKLDKVKLDKSYIEDSLEDNKLSSRSSSFVPPLSDEKGETPAESQKIFINFPLLGGKSVDITEEWCDEMQTLYGNTVNVRDEIKLALAWCNTNTKKKDWKKFLNNWFSNCLKRGGSSSPYIPEENAETDRPCASSSLKSKEEEEARVARAKKLTSQVKARWAKQQEELAKEWNSRRIEG